MINDRQPKVMLHSFYFIVPVYFLFYPFRLLNKIVDNRIFDNLAPPIEPDALHKVEKWRLPGNARVYNRIDMTTPHV